MPPAMPEARASSKLPLVLLLVLAAEGSRLGEKPAFRARAAKGALSRQLRLPVTRSDAMRELGAQLRVATASRNQPRKDQWWAPAAADVLASDWAPAVAMWGSEAEATNQMWVLLEANAQHLLAADRLALRRALGAVLADLVQLREDETAACDQGCDDWIDAKQPAPAAGPLATYRADGGAAWGGTLAAAPAGPFGKRLYARQAALVSFGVAAANTVLQLGGDAPTALAALMGDTLVSPERPTWPAARPDRNTLVAEQLLRSEWLLRRLLFRPVPDTRLLDDTQARQLRKYLAAAARDPRALALLLARRVVELRASERFPKARQLALALEALQVLAPLAHSLELGSQLSELEQSSLLLLFPTSYSAVAEWFDSTWCEADEALEEALAELVAALQCALPPGTKVEARSRKKAVVSVFRKLMRQDRSDPGPGAGGAALRSSQAGLLEPA
ncbi:hypothetical protein T492DRAFT_1145881, partial [Pavlovales sp. CCMP2436]